MGADEWLYIFFAGIAVVSLAIGVFLVKKTGETAGGFVGTLGVSLLMLIFLFRWFHDAASDEFMGTIPWIFNQVFVVGLYLLYMIVAWFVLRRISVNK